MNKALGACATAAAISIATGVWLNRAIDRASTTIGRVSS